MSDKNIQKFTDFNLLSPKTSRQKAIEEERSSTTFYSFALIFVALIIYAMATILHFVVVYPKKIDTEARISKLDEQIATFDDLRADNGELFIKSKLLEPVMAEDVKIAELLSIAEQLVDGIASVEIKSYSRKSDGNFIVLLDMKDFLDINTVMDNALAIKEVTNLFVTRLTKNYFTNVVEGAITFSVVL